MTFREQLIASILGIVGLFVPAEIITQVTHSTHDGVIIACIVLASLVGYVLGIWSKREEDEESRTECR